MRERKHASAEEAWSGLTAYIRRKKPLLASLLDHGKVLKMNETTLHIGFPPKSIYLDSLREEEKKRELNRLCEKYFEAPKQVVILDYKPSGSAEDVESPDLTKAQRNEKIREEARNHPLVREALNVFGGGIAEIKIVSSER